MTSSSVDTAKQDLAFLRELVDEGDWRRPALWFGVTYLAIGLAIVAQIVVIDAPGIALTGFGQLIAIIGVWVAYSIAQAVINARLNPGKLGPGLRSRAAATGFLGMVLSHLTLLIVFVITAISQQEDTFMKLAALSFFALQGGLWLTMHALWRERWQLAVALGWLASAIICSFFLGGDLFGLAVAIVVLVLMVAPGLHMIRTARRIQS